MTAPATDSSPGRPSGATRPAPAADGPSPAPAWFSRAAALGAAAAIAGNALVFAAPARVAPELVSYPLSAGVFGWGQLFFALTQALMTLGIVALVRSGAAGGSRLARAGGIAAVAGFALTVPGELVLILVARQPSESTAVDAASSVFGLGVLLADIGLILFGAVALRQRHWPRPWAGLPMVVGIFQLLVVTPVSLGAGFGSAASLVVIAVLDLLLVALAVLTLRAARRAD